MGQKTGKELKIMVKENKAQEKNINQVQIRGTIVRKICTSSVLIFIIATYNPITNKTDYPRVIAFDNVQDWDERFNVHDRVEIQGVLYTTKNYPHESIVVKNIKHAETKMEAQFTNKDFVPDENIVMLQGEISRTCN